jgi:hypothetical protein
MATNTCTNCGCKKCGCADNALISPAPCPTPAGCPTPLTCSEVFDAECVVYTGIDIECANEVVVATDTNLADALNDIISYFCEFVVAPSIGAVVNVCGTNDYLSVTSTTNPSTGVTTYTVCFDPNELPVYLVDYGTGINVTSSTVGNTTSYIVSNTDPGSAQNIFKNIAVAGQSTVIADSNNDTLTLAAGTGIQITTNAITDEITITNNSPASSVGLGDAGTGAHESLVNDGTGPSLATKGLKAGTGISLSSTATDITISAPSVVSPNLWATFIGDAGFTTANTPVDILTVIGGKEISTNIIGDTLIINSWDYEIGEYVSTEGGVIFHRWLSGTPGGSPGPGSVQNYLVVDTNDLSTSAQWASLNIDISNVESTWDGKTNTTNLIAAGAPGGITVGTAAQLCDASTNNGKTDWYLPAIDELNKLFNNRWEVAQGITSSGGTQLVFTSYWSSTEYDSSTVWYFFFSSGGAFNAFKNSTYYVRAVRKFNT